MSVLCVKLVHSPFYFSSSLLTGSASKYGWPSKGDQIPEHEIGAHLSCSPLHTYTRKLSISTAYSPGTLILAPWTLPRQPLCRLLWFLLAGHQDVARQAWDEFGNSPRDTGKDIDYDYLNNLPYLVPSARTVEAVR